MADDKSTPDPRADERGLEMKDDPELFELEQLYTDSGLPKSERTPERLAQEIRERAHRKAAENLESGNVVRLVPRKPLTLQLVSGLSLAAGVLLGILLPFDVLQRNDSQIGQEVSPPIFMGHEELEKELSELDVNDPRDWQKLILETVISGDMDKAQLLIEEFNRRFPDHDSIDAEE